MTHTNVFDPAPLYCDYYNAFHTQRIHHRLVKRQCHTYELEFLHHSFGGMIINGIFYPLRDHDICFRKPGDIIEAMSPYDCHLLCFSLSGNDFFPSSFNFYDSTFPSNFTVTSSILDNLPARLSLSCFSTVLCRVNELQSIHLRKDPYAKIKAKQLLYNTICPILEEYQQNYSIESTVHPIIKKIVHYLNANFTEDIDLNHYLSQFTLSRPYIYRCFKEAYHITPLQYITRLRMEKAKMQLQLTQYTITDIALSCGYSNYSYFIQQFKLFYGVTPHAFKKYILSQS